MNIAIKENKIKQFFTIRNLLCFFIILCPILDVASFIFRNTLHTNISVSTILRPIIPIIVIGYIFFKDKIKGKMLIGTIIYGIYAICHLYTFHMLKTECSYGEEIQELQYLINYTFMIMNLVSYMYLFVYKHDENSEKYINRLKISALISLTIYIILMYLAIMTRTSSYTYEEAKIGYKGWFESGNSIGTLMILLLFIVIPMTSKKNDKLVRIWSSIIIILTGLYLTTTLGTRTGLFGFAIVVVLYTILKIFFGVIKNKKLIAVAIIILALIAIGVGILGTKTLERRRQLKSRENELYDEMTESTAHVTGDLVQIVKQIKEGTIETSYMKEDVQKTILELYDIANEKEISNTDRRKMQLIYHSLLVKNQKNILAILFGNGYMAHFYEMTFEMEVMAFLYNFGILGFMLYFVPFLLIATNAIYEVIRKKNKQSVEFIMTSLGLWFAICASLLSGYTFFNSSTMMVIIVLAVFIIYDKKKGKA